jgi:hypothetical protein
MMMRLVLFCPEYADSLLETLIAAVSLSRRILLELIPRPQSGEAYTEMVEGDVTKPNNIGNKRLKQAISVCADSA